MVLAVANHRPKRLGMQEGLLQGAGSGRAVSPAMVTSPRGKTGWREQPAAEENRQVWGWGTGERIQGGRRATRRSADCEGRWGTNTLPTLKARARGPTRGCWVGVGAGEGPRRVGEGRSRASHNYKSQPFPTPISKPETLADPGSTYSGRGSLRAPSGCGVGGWSVYRSLSPAAPLWDSLLAPAPPLPVPLPLKQMISGCPAPCCPTGWLPAVCLSWLLQFAAGACLAPRGSPLYSVSCRFFVCRLNDLGLYLFSSRSSLNSEWRRHSGQCGVTLSWRHSLPIQPAWLSSSPRGINQAAESGREVGLQG